MTGNNHQFRYLVRSDLYRLSGRTSWVAVLRQLLVGQEGFHYIFWMRAARATRHHPIGKWCLHPLTRLFLRRARYRFGIAIDFSTNIGPGFYVGHFGGIVVSSDAVIGRNCNISQGVTIGVANRGTRAGVPVIGDNVYIGPGAKIFGRVHVGDGAAIGANAVVTQDVPSGATVAGVPARVLSMSGSVGYVNFTDYDGA